MLSAANARTSHKWLMRFAGLQFVIWALSGLYMVSMDIHFIHGESLSHTQTTRLSLPEVTYSPTDLLTDYPEASHIALTEVLNQPVYRFRLSTANPRWQMVHAKTGEQLPPINEQQAIEIAGQQFSGQANVSHVKRQIPINSAAPGATPLWVITFDDIARSTFYIRQYSAETIRRRHNYWHAFDWMWRLHIMDYDDGENVTNLLLRTLSVLGLLASLSGLVLLVFRLSAKWRVRQ